MILVDSNVFLYAAGVEHPFKARSVAFLESVAEGRIETTIDAEVLQEILHRYRALKRWSEGGVVYDSVRAMFRTLIPISGEILDRARVLLDEHGERMARDALHAAVVEFHSLEAICSFDHDFDPIRGIRRIEPP